MSSHFDSMAAHFGAPMLFDHFGERDANGEEKPIGYTPPGGAASHRWAAIVSAVRFEQDLTSSGIQLLETRTAVVLRSVMEADGVAKFQKSAVVTIDGEPWNLRETETRWGATLVTLGLARKPLVEMGSVRAVVRS